MKSRKIPHISIIPAIENSGYSSDLAVTYIQNYLQNHQLASTEVLDPDVFQFKGLFSEKREKQPRQARTLAKKIRSSSGIFIVTPEFNGEYPEDLRNLIDFLYDEWDHKPVAISTVRDDKAHHSQVINSLQFALWKVNSWSLPVSIPVQGPGMASRLTDASVEASESRYGVNSGESEFNEVLDHYCHKYIQLCTRVKYAV